MSMIYKNLQIDVVSNTSTLLPDFEQKSQNSYCLKIKLRKGDNGFFNIDGLTPTISFINESGVEVVSSTVAVDNPFRGDLSYIIGPALLANVARYTVRLNLTDSTGNRLYIFTFIVNVAKNPYDVAEDNDIEVTISRTEKTHWEETVEKALALEGRVKDLEEGNITFTYPTESGEIPYTFYSPTVVTPPNTSTDNSSPTPMLAASSDSDTNTSPTTNDSAIKLNLDLSKFRDAYQVQSAIVANIEDNLSSTESDKSLSAKMGKELNDRIDNVAGRGRFLSTWNCTTGLADTTPTSDPYTYKRGDYFIVSTVTSNNGENYRPYGTYYSVSEPSTVVEMDDVKPNDNYIYDGTVWILQKNTIPEVIYDNELNDTSVNAVQNKVIKGCLDTNYSKDLKGETLVIHIDPVNGNDTNNGLTANTAIKTGNEIIRRIKSITGNVEVIGHMNNSSFDLSARSYGPDDPTYSIENVNISFTGCVINLVGELTLDNVIFSLDGNSTLNRDTCSPSYKQRFIISGNTVFYMKGNSSGKAYIQDTAEATAGGNSVFICSDDNPGGSFDFIAEGSNEVKIDSNSTYLIYGSKSAKVNVNIGSNVTGTVNYLVYSDQYFVAPTVNITGSPAITKTNWTNNEKYAIINYSGNIGFTPIILDYDADEGTISTSYTYQQILDMVIGKVNENSIPVIWLNNTFGGYDFKKGPFFFYDDGYEQDYKPYNLCFVSNSFSTYDTTQGDGTERYINTVYVDRADDTWHLGYLDINACYAQYVGRKASHPQIGAVNQPVYVNSNGQIVPAYTINNGCTYLYRSDAFGNSRYVGYWFANTADSRSFYLQEFDLNGKRIELYIDSINGNDNNTGTTYNSRIKTWAKLVELINRYYNGSVNVTISNGVSTTSAATFANKHIYFEGSLYVNHTLTFYDCSLHFYEGILKRANSSGHIVLIGNCLLNFGYKSEIGSNTGETDLDGWRMFIYASDEANVKVTFNSPYFYISNGEGSGQPYNDKAVFASYNGTFDISISAAENAYIKCDSLLMTDATDGISPPNRVAISGFNNPSSIKINNWIFDTGTQKESKKDTLIIEDRDLKGGTANIYIDSTNGDDKNLGISSSTKIKTWSKLLDVLNTYKNGTVTVNITGTLAANISTSLQLDNVHLIFSGNITISNEITFKNMYITLIGGTWTGADVSYFENCKVEFYDCTVNDNGLVEGEPVIGMRGSSCYLGELYGNECTLTSTNAYGLFNDTGYSRSEIYLQNVNGSVQYICSGNSNNADVGYGAIIYVSRNGDATLTKTGYCHEGINYITLIRDGVVMNEPSGGSVGDVLTKTSNGYAWGTIDRLPTVSSADNGKILQVVNGVWSAANLPVDNGEVE